MNDTPHNEFCSLLTEKITACAGEIKSLERDERRDEAVFVKIRMNVYDIFRTVFNASANHPDAHRFFLEKLDQIPENWRTSLSLALQHGNEDKAHIEQIKLNAAAEVRNLFLKSREVRA